MSQPPFHEPTSDEAEKLVQDAIGQIEVLAELSKKHPKAFRPVARQMPAWPVMRYRRETGHDDFWHVLHRLELGEDYPLDITSNARSHPSSAMGQYLIRWVERLHQFRLRGTWPAGAPHQTLTAMKPVLEAAMQMPRLTKATSDDWTKRILVPLIVVCDAGKDEASCLEPVLRAIWAQRGVKSLPTFKSRLLSKVRQLLKSLARQD